MKFSPREFDDECCDAKVSHVCVLMHSERFSGHRWPQKSEDFIEQDQHSLELVGRVSEQN